MSKVYKKRVMINYPPTPPTQMVVRFENMEWKRWDSMIIHTPDFRPFEARICNLDEKWGKVSLSFNETIEDLTAWITLTMYPKTSLASRCTLVHNHLRIHFPFPRQGKSKHLFDIVNYNNVIVAQNEAKVWGTKVEILTDIVERKVFNPKQLKLF